MRRRTFITLISSAERLIGGTTMQYNTRSVIAATTVLVIAAFPDPAKGGGYGSSMAATVITITRTPTVTALGLRNYYPKGYWHPRRLLLSTRLSSAIQSTLLSRVLVVLRW